MSLFDSIKQLFGRGRQPGTARGGANGDGARADGGSGGPRFIERRSRPRSGAPEDTRILLIDDSTTIIAMLRRMLRQNRYETLEAADGETGLAMALENPPDIIFLDIVLPGMNGFETLRRLRREEATREVPVIMISGNEQAVEQFYAQRIGADDFMKKPFSREEVFARIDRLRGEDGQFHRRRKPGRDDEHGDHHD